MEDKTSRRNLLGHVLGSTIGSVVPFFPRINPHNEEISSDILPELRIRFPDRVHPDLVSVQVMKRDDDVYLVLRIGGCPVWAGSELLDEWGGSNELWSLVLVNDDGEATDLSFACFCPSVSAEENATRLLDSPDVETICFRSSIFRLPEFFKKRHNSDDNVP